MVARRALVGLLVVLGGVAGFVLADRTGDRTGDRPDGSRIFFVAGG
jgi:hypothetical protein